MDKKQLRQYLEMVRNLEIDVYTMEQSIMHLSRGHKGPPPKTSYPYICSKPYEPYKPSRRKVYVFWRWNIFKTLFEALKDYMEYSADYRKDMRRYEQEHKKWEADVEKYEQELLQHKEKCRVIDAEHDKEVALVNTFNASIDDQLVQLMNEQKATKEALQKLYDTGVLYIKYRSYMPVAMFCEYMDSGRRDKLEGVDGMYDLYETELTAKKIVGELTTINSNLASISNTLGSIATSLTGIQRNQMLIYDEICRSNALSEQLAEDVITHTEQMVSAIAKQTQSQADAYSKMNSQLAEMGQAAKVTAYNSEASKRRADAIAQVVEYEHTQAQADRFWN